MNKVIVAKIIYNYLSRVNLILRSYLLFVLLYYTLVKLLNNKIFTTTV